MLLQYPDDLFVKQATVLHALVLSLGQSELQTGLGRRGNVMATLLGISFVVHQAGSSLGAWGGGLIFDVYGSYDRAWQIGTIIGISAGLLQMLAGGPTRHRDRAATPALATS